MTLSILLTMPMHMTFYVLTSILFMSFVILLSYMLAKINLIHFICIFFSSLMVAKSLPGQTVRHIQSRTINGRLATLTALVVIKTKNT